MVAFLPIPGGHIKLAERFVDPAFSFTMGWNYWSVYTAFLSTHLSYLLLWHRYNWVIVLPAELSAASVLIGFWNKEINPAVWITICMIVVVVINLLGAGKLLNLGGTTSAHFINPQVHTERLNLSLREFFIANTTHRRCPRQNANAWLWHLNLQLYQSHHHYGSYHSGHCARPWWYVARFQHFLRLLIIIEQAVLTMIDLDSASGNTLVPSYSSMALQDPRDDSWASGLSWRRPPSHTLEPRLLLYVHLTGKRLMNVLMFFLDRSLLAKQRTQDVTFRKQSSESTSVSPTNTARVSYVLIALCSTRYSPFLHPWYHRHWSLGSFQR